MGNGRERALESIGEHRGEVITAERLVTSRMWDGVAVGGGEGGEYGVHMNVAERPVEDERAQGAGARTRRW